MNDQQKEIKQLNTGWKIILLVWGSILISLGIYLFVCIMIEKDLQKTVGSDFPLETFKYILLGISFFTLIAVRFLRKFLLRPGSSGRTSPGQHPAVGRYMIATVIISALLESIGIYGLVIFLMVQDHMALYQFLIISAAGMIYHRPRKEELFNLAAQMK